MHIEHPSEPTHTEFRIVSPKTCLLIGGCLLVLTAATTAISYVELGVFNAVVALAIACMKATLVVLFFMHIKYSSKLTKLTVGAGIFTFLVLITMTMSDYVSRAWGRWQGSAGTGFSGNRLCARFRVPAGVPVRPARGRQSQYPTAGSTGQQGSPMGRCGARGW